MKSEIYRFYEFMTGCRGNWRNTIFISCSACKGYCSSDQRGCLLATDRDGRPRVISVIRFEKLSGEHIDPSECVGQISKNAFETLYDRYLDWELNHDYISPKCQLCVISHESQTPVMYSQSTDKEKNIT